MAATLDGVFDGILRRSLWAFEKDRQAKRSLWRSFSNPSICRSPVARPLSTNAWARRSGRS